MGTKGQVGAVSTAFSTAIPTVFSVAISRIEARRTHPRERLVGVAQRAEQLLLLPMRLAHALAKRLVTAERRGEDGLVRAAGVVTSIYELLRREVRERYVIGT